MNEFKRLLQYVRPHWLTFLFALVAMVLVAVFENSIDVLLIPIFGQFCAGREVQSEQFAFLLLLLQKAAVIAALLTISLMLLSFAIRSGVAEYFSSYLMATIGQSAVLDLRSQLYDHLLRQPASFF